MNDLSRKIWILTEGIFNTTENDLQEITKIANLYLSAPELPYLCFMQKMAYKLNIEEMT